MALATAVLVWVLIDIEGIPTCTVTLVRLSDVARRLGGFAWLRMLVMKTLSFKELLVYPG